MIVSLLLRTQQYIIPSTEKALPHPKSYIPSFLPNLIKTFATNIFPSERVNMEHYMLLFKREKKIKEYEKVLNINNHQRNMYHIFFTHSSFDGH